MPPSPEKTEEADSHETLVLDDAQYPQLPDDVMKRHLERWGAILRQFVAVVRHMLHSNPVLLSLMMYI